MASKRGYGIINGITKKFYKHYIVMNSQTKKIKKAYEVANGITVPCWSADRILGFGNSSPYPVYEMELPTDSGTALVNTPNRVNSIAKWGGKYWIVSNGNLYYSIELDTWTRFTHTELPNGLQRVYAGGQFLLVYGKGTISDQTDGFACFIDSEGSCRRTILYYDSDMTTEVDDIVMNDDGSYGVVIFRSNGRNTFTIQYHIGYYSDSGTGRIIISNTGTEYRYHGGMFGNGKFVLISDYYSTGSTCYIGYGTNYNLTNKYIYGDSASTIGFFKGRFYLRADNGNILAASDPSGTWDVITNVPSISKTLICGNVMYGFNGTTVYQTTDGQSWEMIGTSSHSSDLLYFDEA